MKKENLLKELRAKDTKSLFQELEESRKRLAELRFKASFRKLKNYKEISQTRKKIARVWTILSEQVSAELKKTEGSKE